MKITNFHRLAHLASPIVDSFRVEIRVILEREKEEIKQIMMKKNETKAKARQNYNKLNKQESKSCEML